MNEERSDNSVNANKTPQTTNGSIVTIDNAELSGVINVLNKGKSSKNEEIKRETWGGKAEFVLSCLGYAVGLGNVWKFPYLVYSNGGGAFLIPYIITLILVGLPCFFMEMIVGQYSGCGPMHLWSLAPLFSGIGWGMEIVTIFTTISYNIIMGWAFYYMFASWQAVLPWYGCDHYYNTPFCYTKREASKYCEQLVDGTNIDIYYNFTTNNNNTFDDISTTTSWWFKVDNNTNTTMTTTSSPTTTSISWWFNNTCYNASYCNLINFNDIGCNKTYVLENRVGATEEYYKHRMLAQSPSIDETGYLQWESVLVLLFAWIVCYLCVIKGIKSAGKVVYFTALFPYVILLILLVRGALLPGALQGVIFYIKPDWSKLANAKVWVDSAGQVFFSLSVGMGGLMTFASYNKFNNNIYRDTLIVVILDLFTSVLAGFAIFSIIGHLAYALGKDIGDVVEKGPGLAFIVYPEVVTYLEPPQLWSTLFFLMLITLGIDTQMASIETVMTACVDYYPVLRRWKPLVAAVICALMFLLGLPMCAQSGVYWLELMSEYSSGWSLVLIATAEIIIFSWLYGARRLMDDVETMTGVKLYFHWWIVFKIIAPALLIGVFIFSLIDYKPISYNNGEPYSVWSQVLGWMMAWVSIIVVPIVAVYIVWKSYSDDEYSGLKFHKRIWKLMHPSKNWMSSVERVALKEQELQRQPTQYINECFDNGGPNDFYYSSC